ncbi:MAG: hypothetical protein ACXVRH_05265, partial [Thermoleophilaceae bacterium]
PSVPAAALVLALRLAEPAHRTPALALAEFALYVAATVAATMTLERPLMREVAGYLRRRPSPAAAAL